MYKTFVNLSEKDGTFIGNSIMVDEFETIADANRAGMNLCSKFVRTITVRKYDDSKTNIIGGINDTGKVVSIKTYGDEDSLELRNYSAEIIEVFEDILARNGYYIPDECRQGDSNEAHIYGKTYGEMITRIENILKLMLNK